MTVRYNCFVRWVLILSRTSSRIDPISDARCTGRQHSKKHSQNTVYYLTKSGICMPTFHIAQIYIHHNSSRYSEVRPILKNLVMPLPNLRWTSRCPVSRRNFTKICFNSGLISLSNSRCKRNLGFVEWTWLAAYSVHRQYGEHNVKSATPF